MEVHHHPHVERKGFKEYFLEFLMIFVAVTMGFIAESTRENIANRVKEKHYIKSIITDLKKDTANINTMVTGNGNLIMGLDTLLDLLSGPQ